MSGIGDFIAKGEELAKEHPDQVKGALGKIEEFIDEKTGGQQTDAIHKGAAMLEGQLGLGGDEAPAGN